MENIFRGTGPAIITPFKSDLSVDLNALDQLLDFQIAGGIDFAVALGTTAETSTLTHNERHQVFHFIKDKINKRIPLMVGFGGNNTAEVISHIKSADFDGVDAILSVVPYYSKPSQEGVYRHFMAIAAVSPVPIMLYNIPSRCGINMTVETMQRLANDSEKFIGVKEAGGDVNQVKAIINNIRPSFEVLSGDDAMICDFGSIGGKGVISVMANAFPAETKELNVKSMANDPAAKAMQADFKELINLLFAEGNPGGIKAVLNIQGKIENALRLPLCPVSDGIYAALKNVLKKM